MNITGRPIYQKGERPQKSKPLRDAARDAQCEFAIPGVCCNDPARVVGCHVSVPGFSAGMAQKNDDIFLIDGCDCCHAVFDSRDKFAAAPIGWLDVLVALMRSQSRRKAAGLISVRETDQ